MINAFHIESGHEESFVRVTGKIARTGKKRVTGVGFSPGAGFS